MKAPSLLLRRASVVLAVLIIAGSLFLKNHLAGQYTPPGTMPDRKTVRTIEVIEVNPGLIQVPIVGTGKLLPENKIELFAEVSGIFQPTGKDFKEGMNFRAGELLIQLDDSEARLAIQSLSSNLLNMVVQAMPDLRMDFPQSSTQWENWVNNFDSGKPIKDLPSPSNEKEKYFLTVRGILNQFFQIKSQEERLAKYRIYAPFSGLLTQALIQPGTLVRAGQKLGEFSGLGNFELPVSITQEEAALIQVGKSVLLKDASGLKSWNGKVTRINNQLDPTTQMVRAFIGVSGNELLQGMYLTAYIETGAIENAVRLPRELIFDQEYLFIVENGELRKQKVQVHRIYEKDLVVTGLSAGLMTPATSIPGAFEGMKIQPAGKPKKDQSSTSASGGNS